MAGDLHQTGASRDSDDDLPEPPQLRRFRRLVSLLMVVMMVGILGIMAALIWKLTQPELAHRQADTAAIDGDIIVDPNFDVLSVSRAGELIYLLLKNTQSDERFIEERNAEDQELVRRYRLISEEN